MGVVLPCFLRHGCNSARLNPTYCAYIYIYLSIHILLLCIYIHIFRYMYIYNIYTYIHIHICIYRWYSQYCWWNPIYTRFLPDVCICTCIYIYMYPRFPMYSPYIHHIFPMGSANLRGWRWAERGQAVRRPATGMEGCPKLMWMLFIGKLMAWHTVILFLHLSAKRYT